MVKAGKKDRKEETRISRKRGYEGGVLLLYGFERGGRKRAGVRDIVYNRERGK